LEVPTQAVVDGWKPSAGQLTDEPVQLSATSHWPAEARHCVVLGLKPVWQAPATQWSGALQSPLDGSPQGPVLLS
jgi:hypothetical protein